VAQFLVVRQQVSVENNQAMTEISDPSFFSPKLIAQILNLLAVLLAVVATVVVVRRLRGQSLALWLLVVWFLPLIGPIVALVKSKERV
jgi:uncharacterized membrane protein YhaH (DUF805 family)